MNRERLQEAMPAMAGWAAGVAVTAAVLLGPTRHWADDDLGHELRAIATLHEHIATAGDAAKEAAYNQHRHEQKLGEACLAILKPYLADGVLADMTEDAAVQDIGGSDTDVCGETLTDVRITLRSQSQTEAATHEAEKTLMSKRNSLDDDIANEKDRWSFQADVKWLAGIGGGIWLGSRTRTVATRKLRNKQNNASATSVNS